MRRLLILFLGLLLGCNCVPASTNMLPPLQPMVGLGGNNNFQNSPNFEPEPNTIITQNPANQAYPDVSQIEKQLFGRTYANQNIALRLSRIEKTLFTTTYPNANNRQRIDNIISNYNQINKYPNISRNVLSKLENKVFSQTFSQNSPERRIERLEQKVLGAVQGGDMQSRYDNLQTAVKNYNTAEYYNSAPNSGGTGLRALAGLLGGSLMGGSMTGFTPSMGSYNNGYGYNNGYNGYNNGLNGYNNNAFGNICPPSGSGIYKGYRSNTGYSDSYSDFGTGTGVTILD